FTATPPLEGLGRPRLKQLAGLCPGLCAFLAGVLLAEADFLHEIEAHLEPLHRLLRGLFSIAEGMNPDLAGGVPAPLLTEPRVEPQVHPSQGLLLGLCLMAVGMSIDLARVVREPLLIEAGVLGLLAVKFAILFLLGRRPGRLDARGALLLGRVLALGGEFAFVVFGEARRAGLIDGVLRDRLVAVVGVTMALTPLLLIAMTRLLRESP